MIYSALLALDQAHDMLTATQQIQVAEMSLVDAYLLVISSSHWTTNYYGTLTIINLYRYNYVNASYYTEFEGNASLYTQQILDTQLASTSGVFLGGQGYAFARFGARRLAEAYVLDALEHTRTIATGTFYNSDKMKAMYRHVLDIGKYDVNDKRVLAFGDTSIGARATSNRGVWTAAFSRLHRFDEELFTLANAQRQNASFIMYDNPLLVYVLHNRRPPPSLAPVPWTPRLHIYPDYGFFIHLNRIKLGLISAREWHGHARHESHAIALAVDRRTVLAGAGYAGWEVGDDAYNLCSSPTKDGGGCDWGYVHDNSSSSNTFQLRFSNGSLVNHQLLPTSVDPASLPPLHLLPRLEHEDLIFSCTWSRDFVAIGVEAHRCIGVAGDELLVDYVRTLGASLLNDISSLVLNWHLYAPDYVNSTTIESISHLATSQRQVESVIFNGVEESAMRPHLIREYAATVDAELLESIFTATNVIRFNEDSSAFVVEEYFVSRKGRWFFSYFRRLRQSLFSFKNDSDAFNFVFYDYVADNLTVFVTHRNQIELLFLGNATTLDVDVGYNYFEGLQEKAENSSMPATFLTTTTFNGTVESNIMDESSHSELQIVIVLLCCCILSTLSIVVIIACVLRRRHRSRKRLNRIMYAVASSSSSSTLASRRGSSAASRRLSSVAFNSLRSSKVQR